MRTTALALTAASALFLTGTAHAVEGSYTFATFQQLGTTKIATYTPGVGSSTLTIDNSMLPPVFSNFVVFIGTCCTLPPYTPPPPMANIFTDTIIQFSATSSMPVVDTGPQFEQPGFAGSATFTSLSNPGLNLLTVTFTHGVLNVGKGPAAGASVISVSASNIAYTSDIFKPHFIANPVDFAINMSALSGLPFGIGSGYGTPFTANAGGGFSAVIPEPATWAMLIAGFGLVGWSMRRRRTATTLA